MSEARTTALASAAAEEESCTQPAMEESDAIALLQVSRAEMEITRSHGPTGAGEKPTPKPGGVNELALDGDEEHENEEKLNIYKLIRFLNLLCYT